MTTRTTPRSRIPWAMMLTLSLFVGWIGCMAMGGESYSAADYEAYAPSSSSEQKASRSTGLAASPGDFVGGFDDTATRGRKDALSDELSDGSGERFAEFEVDEDASEDSPVEGRKLIRTGDISVTVDDYEPFRAAMDVRLKELGGFVSDANLDHYSGNVSWATLTVRVSAQHFDELVSWTESQVEVSSLNVSTQDVTEEWVDIRSRIDNWKATEKRLLEILDDRTADLGDVLAVERELSRVREEIERAEGRLRVLADQVELATLTIHVSVRNPYQPAVDPPGFGQIIADTFFGSLNAMATLGKALVLIAVGGAPWFLLMGLGVYIVYRIIRGLIRRKSA
jgi:hypothetical protein